MPLPSQGEVDDFRLGASSAWFPLVGFTLGAALAAMAYLLVGIFTPAVVAALWLTAAALVTGGLHLDGLMDTADGLMGGREPARILEIMRDSRVGAMGALAAVLSLLLKWTLLTSWLTQPGAQLSALVLIPTLGRWAMVGGLFFYPYARPGGGLGKPFTLGARPLHLIIATLTVLVVSWYIKGWTGLIIMLGTGLTAAITARHIVKKIGGLTGDTYGAINEVSEAAALLLLVGLETSVL